MSRGRNTRQVIVLREQDSIWSPAARVEVGAAVHRVHQALRQSDYDVIPLQVESVSSLTESLVSFEPNQSVVFNWFEGVEAGAADAIQVAAALTLLGYTFTGAGARAMQVAQDKPHAKRVLMTKGIPTPMWQMVDASNLADWRRFPAIVQVANEHGSEYLTAHSVVHSQRELARRVEELSEYGNAPLIVSEFIDGPEFTVSLWGNGKLQVLPLIEIDYSDLPDTAPRLRTYESKFETRSSDFQMTRLVCPAARAKEIYTTIEEVARRAFRALDLRDYGRIDIRVRDEIPYVIDVNCNPDITEGSSFVVAAEFAGYDYGAMVNRIITLALERAQRGVGAM